MFYEFNHFLNNRATRLLSPSQMGPIAGSKLPAMELLLWLLVVFVTTTTSASQQCANSAHSVKGKYLKDHVISSRSAAHIGDCLVKCSSEPRCKSINFRFKGLFCELNDADRYMHPWDYGPGSTWHAYNDYPSKVRPSLVYTVIRRHLPRHRAMKVKTAQGPGC